MKSEKTKTIYVLRTSKPDGTSYGGFRWPSVGETATASDWDARPVCGNGLHGYAKGEGEGDQLSRSPDALWQVIEALEDSIVQLDGGKCKFPSGLIVYAGIQEEAIRLVKERHPEAAVYGCVATAGVRGTATAGDLGTAIAGNGGTAIAGVRGTATAGDDGTATAGYRGTATAGDYGTAIAGDYGTATAGYRGTATAGDDGTATAGDYGTATAGDYGTATAGDYGTATAGDYGTAIAGNDGTATAGDYGTATAGDYGTATAGYRGTATAGDYGTATAGDYGILQLSYWSGGRQRVVTAYVGEKGIKANQPYKLNARYEVVRVLKPKKS